MKKRGAGAAARARAAAQERADAPRVARRERKREQSREEILEAARRAIMRDGVAVTLDAIAREVGLTKAALYYYFPSKDALLFELVYRIFEADAAAVEQAVERADGGPEAISALIRTTVTRYAARMDDFRLAFLANQVSPEGVSAAAPELLARLRPLNGRTYGGATKKLEAQRGALRSGVAPRRLVFLAHLAAIGLLTMKGMVERVGDPLLYSDEQLVDDLGKIFAAAASPR